MRAPKCPVLPKGSEVNPRRAQRAAPAALRHRGEVYWAPSAEVGVAPECPAAPGHVCWPCGPVQAARTTRSNGRPGLTLGCSFTRGTVGPPGAGPELIPWSLVTSTLQVCCGRPSPADGQWASQVSTLPDCPPGGWEAQPCTPLRGGCPLGAWGARRLEWTERPSCALELCPLWGEARSCGALFLVSPGRRTRSWPLPKLRL